VVRKLGMSVRRRCFVSDGTLLLLPSFGAYTGGLDVREEAIASLFLSGCTIYALGRERVYAVANHPAANHPARRRNTTVESQPNDKAISTADTP
jgi:metallophosphoesterase superfamily enzyme